MQNLEELLDFTGVKRVVNLGDIKGCTSKIIAAVIRVHEVLNHLRVCRNEAKIDEVRHVANDQAEIAIARRKREVDQSASQV